MSCRIARAQQAISQHLGGVVDEEPGQRIGPHPQRILPADGRHQDTVDGDERAEDLGAEGGREQQRRGEGPPPEPALGARDLQGAVAGHDQFEEHHALDHLLRKTLFPQYEEQQKRTGHAEHRGDR